MSKFKRLPFPPPREDRSDHVQGAVIFTAAPLPPGAHTLVEVGEARHLGKNKAGQPFIVVEVTHELPAGTKLYAVVP